VQLPVVAKEATLDFPREWIEFADPGDPTARAVDVYIPSGHDGRGLPLLVDLVGITSSGLSHTNWAAFQENMPERLDRLT